MGRSSCAWLIPLVCLLGGAGTAESGAGLELRVAVRDPAGEAVLDAVVSAHPVDTATAGPGADGASHFIIDQVGRQFVPHVSAVSRGTTVEFPNSDQIRHSIYSFSASKTFEIKLYRGFEAPPIHFDREGLVILGCNIHDYMLGYVYVLDTKHFGVTDEGGDVVLRDLSPGPWLLRVRHPRVEEQAILIERQLEIGSSGALELTLPTSPPPRPASLEPPEDELQDLFGARGR